MKIVRIVTVPIAFVHIEFQIKEFKAKGFEVHLICSGTDDIKKWEERLQTPIIQLEIRREISILKDLQALYKLFVLFRRHRFDLVHSSTPKAGLITAIAGFMARVPIRLHTFTGQRWATMIGPKRWLLKKLDSLIIALNTQCYADSRSQIKFIQDQGVDSNKRVICLGEGSYGGIDTKKFHPILPEVKTIQEKKLNLITTPFRFMYLGRLVKDKGLNELILAFDKLSKEFEGQLLLVGPEENETDPISDVSKKIIECNTSIIAYGPTTKPQELLQISDVLTIPSYREGFGTVVLEAAGCGIPAIGTDIPGLKDAIVDKKTGLLVTLKSVDELYAAMKWCIENKSAIKTMAENALWRCQNHFDCHILSKVVTDEYSRLKNQNASS